MLVPSPVVAEVPLKAMGCCFTGMLRVRPGPSEGSRCWKQERENHFPGRSGAVGIVFASQATARKGMSFSFDSICPDDLVVPIPAGWVLLPHVLLLRGLSGAEPPG